MLPHFDIVIIGAGLVGASLALALERIGYQVALIEAKTDTRLSLTELEWDQRIYALSPANRRLLQHLNSWPDEERVCAIKRMHIYGDLNGHLTLDADDVDEQALAWIVEHRRVFDRLYPALQASTVELFTGVQGKSLTTDAQQIGLILTQGQRLSANLLIGADGARSWVRQQSDLRLNSIKTYSHQGVVANFNCSVAHHDCAHQWFLAEGVLAYLPLPGQRISIVWSTPNPESLMTLPPQELADRVAQAGHGTLGQLTPLTAATSLPLYHIQLPRITAQRMVLVGDAAHTVHPLAGQGMNLGLQDVEKLAQCLASGHDAGDWLRLRRYERQRREAVLGMQWVCDGLFKLFQPHTLPGIAQLRNMGLSLTQRCLPIKRSCILYAIG